MSTELTVAVISAIVALVSILLSAKTARSTAMLQARLQDESELRRKQADKAERLDQVVARYRVRS
jgi:CHASE1-domain containing sensor protein